MSTNSIIHFKNDTDVILYSHWDGHPYGTAGKLERAIKRKFESISRPSLHLCFIAENLDNCEITSSISQREYQYVINEEHNEIIMKLPTETFSYPIQEFLTKFGSTKWVYSDEYGVMSKPIGYKISDQLDKEIFRLMGTKTFLTNPTYNMLTKQKQDLIAFMENNFGGFH
jgi:hypothetical protein